VPENLLMSFSEEISADNWLFIRVLLQSAALTGEKDGFLLASAFLDIFAYAEEVNQLLAGLA
jgi:hypothetical protein